MTDTDTTADAADPTAAADGRVNAFLKKLLRPVRSVVRARDEETPAKGKPLVIERAGHTISRKNICEPALKVLYRLNSSGYLGYLVGGGVRDLLLGAAPKDFDITTDARPGEIKKLFRNAFLIGRRFRLAHIRFGQTVIETSTFRRLPEETESEDGELLVRDDNTFGTPEEDAFRRDFTVNALFYDIATFSVIDYVGGVRDLRRKVIRCIGDPDIRFREDPVRMLRAVRFASRLGFRIESASWKAILRHAPELAKAARARLYEDTLKLFGYRSGEGALRLLAETGLLRPILPQIADHLEACDAEARELFFLHLRALDRAAPGDEAPPDAALIFSVLIYPLLRERLAGEATRKAAVEIIRELANDLNGALNVPRRVRDAVKRILTAHDRMSAPGKSRFNKKRFVSSDAFGPALELLGITAAAVDDHAESFERWTALAREVGESGAGAETRPDDSADGDGDDGPSSGRSSRSRSRRRRRRKKTSRDGASAGNAASGDEPSATPDAKEEASPKTEETASEAPTKKKKRRRRRRKKKTAPSTDGTAAGEASAPSAAQEASADAQDASGDGIAPEAQEQGPSEQKETRSSGASARKRSKRRRRNDENGDRIHTRRRNATEKKPILDTTGGASAPQAPHWLDEI